MTTLLIEADYTFLFVIVIAIMFCPPILFGLIGYSFRNKNKRTAKIFYIIAIVYLLIGLGICGSMLL